MFQLQKHPINTMTSSDKIHIINTVMTGRGTPRIVGDRVLEETDRWINERIFLFKKYTLASLLNQTNKNFLHWICFRNHNPKWDELADYLKSINYNFVFTYNGQCHWDDRSDQNPTLEKRFAKSLEALKPHIEGKKWVYYTLLDSDDMFMKDAVELIQQQEPEMGKSLVFQKGYAINHQTKELADWFCVSPPFYTIIYPAETFLDPKEKFLYEVGLNSHEDAVEIFRATIMPENKYSYLIHSYNKSTSWEHKFRGKIYTDDNFRKQVFKDLGI